MRCSGICTAIISGFALVGLSGAIGSCGASPTRAHPWAPSAATCNTAIKACEEPPKDDTDLSQVVCIDFRGDVPYRRPLEDATATDDSLLQPNRNIIVRVVTSKDGPGDVSVTLGDTAGETIIKASTSEVAAASDAIRGTHLLHKSADGCRVYEAPTFVPRKPGLVTITISGTKMSNPVTASKWTMKVTKTETTASAGASPTEATVAVNELTGESPQKQSHALELLIPQVYSGAIRIGLGMIWGAADHAYGTRKVADSDMLAVIDNGPAR